MKLKGGEEGRGIEIKSPREMKSVLKIWFLNETHPKKNM